MLGVAQGSGTDGAGISGGVLLKGLDTKNTGGTPGTIIYISNTAGATSTSAGTINKPIGAIRSSSGFYFDPTLVVGRIDDSLISTSTILASNIFGPGTDGDVTITANSTTTLTRDMFYNNLVLNGAILSNGWRIFC